MIRRPPGSKRPDTLFPYTTLCLAPQAPAREAVTDDARLAALQTRRAPTSLGALQVRVGGDGPAIVFWPSLMMDGRLWAAQATHFIGCPRVVPVDPPGHGGSDALRRNFRFDECARGILHHHGRASCRERVCQ